MRCKSIQRRAVSYSFLLISFTLFTFLSASCWTFLCIFTGFLAIFKVVTSTTTARGRSSSENYILPARKIRNVLFLVNKLFSSSGVSCTVVGWHQQSFAGQMKNTQLVCGQTYVLMKDINGLVETKQQPDYEES